MAILDKGSIIFFKKKLKKNKIKTKKWGAL